jgi:probable blue pigment (indigoidine) exporter
MVCHLSILPAPGPKVHYLDAETLDIERLAAFYLHVEILSIEGVPMRPPVLLITAFTPAVWGTTYAVTTEFLPPGRPLLAGMLRALPAGLLLLAVTRQLPRGRWWWRSAVLGMLHVGIFFPLLFVSAYRLPGGMAAVLGAAQPLVVAGLTTLLLSERVALRTVVAAVVGAGGVALAVLTAAARLDPIGLAAGLTATGSMALGLVLAKRWGRPEVSLLTSTGWQLAAGGLALVPVALLVEGPPPALSAGNVLGYAYLSVLGGAVAYSVWFWGLERLPAARVSLLGLLSPVVATVVGWAALGQDLTPVQVTGMVVAFGAVVWGQRSAHVRVLDDVVRKSDAGRAQHGLADPVGAGDVLRGDALQQRDHRRHHGVERVDPAGLRPHAELRLDEPRPEGVAVGQQLDDLPLGAPLDPRPHLPAVGVGAGTGDVDKGRPRVESGEGAGRHHRVVVGDPGVGRLVHADGGNPKAVETGVGAGQLLPDGRDIGEIRKRHLAQLGVRDAGRRADHGDDLIDVRRQQTLAQHALADHAGRTEDHDLHDMLSSVGRRPAITGRRCA